MQEYLFEAGEIDAFRGTDGLKFNHLRIKKSAKEDTPGTKIRGNFLLKCFHRNLTGFQLQQKSLRICLEVGGALSVNELG